MLPPVAPVLAATQGQSEADGETEAAGVQMWGSFEALPLPNMSQRGMYKRYFCYAVWRSLEPERLGLYLHAPLPWDSCDRLFVKESEAVTELSFNEQSHLVIRFRDNVVADKETVLCRHSLTRHNA